MGSRLSYKVDRENNTSESLTIKYQFHGANSMTIRVYTKTLLRALLSFQLDPSSSSLGIAFPYLTPDPRPRYSVTISSRAFAAASFRGERLSQYTSGHPAHVRARLYTAVDEWFDEGVVFGVQRIVQGLGEGRCIALIVVRGKVYLDTLLEQKPDHIGSSVFRSPYKGSLDGFISEVWADTLLKNQSSLSDVPLHELLRVDMQWAIDGNMSYLIYFPAGRFTYARAPHYKCGSLGTMRKSLR
ncbi:hypothetical protein BKA56DRAFT_681839 [Ilyonectria sp. MPI-CAGE-AT-0026]|nr:hypothetical protein BKA56DRAFT_681839 [Ilyonectria sp. MPI-CAGE-AT-0026]